MIYKKIIGILVCILFVGASVIPSISGNNEIIYKEYSKTLHTLGVPTVYVDDDYNDTHPGWNVTHFDKIQNGIDASDSNVIVYNGTYDYEDVHPISITKYGLVVEGAGTDDWGNDIGGAVIIGYGIRDVVHIEADNVKFRNFTVQNSGPSIEFHAGIWLDFSEDCEISYNIITNNKNGIGMRQSHNNNIHHNHIFENDVDGILLRRSNGNVIDKNIIENNIINGIWLWDSNSNRIGVSWEECCNIITGNECGIKMLYYCTDNIVLANCISNNSEVGIFLNQFCTGNRFKRNLIYNNSERSGDSYGGLLIYMYCSGNSFLENNFVWTRPNAYCLMSFLNFFSENYWDDWDGSGSYLIPGFPPEWDLLPSPERYGPCNFTIKLPHGQNLLKKGFSL
jgi:parallel beta-helix repeat protein